MTITHIDNMIKISLKKEGLLNEFFDLTKLQAGAIKDEKFDSLENLLLDKSKLMVDIDELDIKFLDEFNMVKELESIDTMEDIDIGKYPNVKELKDLARRISQVLKEVYELDNRNTLLISKNLDGVKSELKHVKDAKVAYKGYNVEQSGSIMIDERK